MPGPVSNPYTIVFDLDGTLIDPFDGITRSIRYALAEMGLPAPPADELAWCIGPPLFDSFTTLLGGEASASRSDVEEAIRLYRVRFAQVGIFECELYDGIPGMLADLTHQGFGLFVATSKPHVYAGPIVEHLEIAPWFRGVYGAELDGTRRDKGDLLAYLLDEEQLSAERVVMVGDRDNDVKGARQVGIRSIGVTYGYALPGELETAAPDATVDTPREIAGAISGFFAECSRGPQRDFPG